MIDAHVHIDEYSDVELVSVLAELAARPMLAFAVSMDPESFERTEAIADRSPWVIPAFGIHPWNAVEHVEQLGALDRYIDRAPMLGEVGLDRRFLTRPPIASGAADAPVTKPIADDPARYPAQLVVFEYFVTAARDLGKVLNIHTTGAERQIIDMLDSQVAALTIVHWYSGPLAEMDELIAMGASFTVGVEVMHSEHIRAVARHIPTDQLLIETDNPAGEEWLTGTRGMPSSVSDVIERLATERGTSVAELTDTVRHNAARFLDSHPAMARWASLARSI